MFSIFVVFGFFKFYMILKCRLPEFSVSESWNFYYTNLYLKIHIKLYCALKIMIFYFLESIISYLSTTSISIPYIFNLILIFKLDSYFSANKFDS